MKKLGYLILLTISMTACKKDQLEIPTKPPIEKPGENPPGEDPSGENPPPPNPVSTINLRARMVIGEITYDSIPASLALFSWDSLGERSLSFHSLVAGTNKLTLPTGKQKFQFKLSKWGSTDELVINTKDIVADSVYVLGTSREAKKLKTEYVSVLKSNKYEAESKTDYIYKEDGNLDQIIFNRKKEDGRPYIHQVARFEYQDKKVQRIARYNEANDLYGYTSFSYSNGRITGMYEKGADQETIAKVEYSFSPRQEVIINYTYPSKTYTMGYYMQFAEGNLMEGNGITSHHTSELAKYQYDHQVNPYIHMNWPDLFLSHSSKNNVIAQQQSFSNGFPVAVPSGYSYTYDSEGYPKELIKTYKSGSTGQYLYTTKTEFVYY